jgi:hypothetical protein
MELKEIVQFTILCGLAISLVVPLFMAISIRGNVSTTDSGFLANATNSSIKMTAFTSNVTAWTNSTSMNITSIIGNTNTLNNSGSFPEVQILTVAFGVVINLTITIAQLFMSLPGLLILGLDAIFAIVTDSISFLPPEFSGGITAMLLAISAAAVALITITVMIEIAKIITGKEI